MKTNKILENLKQDIVIPEIVQKKADDTFREIHESVERQSVSKPIPLNRSGRRHIWSKKAVAAAVLVCLFASTVTVSAATRHIWGKSLKSRLRVTSEQEQALRDSALLDSPMQTAEDAGIKVTSIQSIVDDQHAYLAFQVEGYDFSKGSDWGFEGIGVTINGEDMNYSGGFENGEFQLIVSAPQGTDSIIGKEIQVGFTNFGIAEKAKIKDMVKGNWNLSWTLQGSKDIKEYNFSEVLGDSKAILTGARISPISMKLTFEMPKTVIQETGMDENGQEIPVETYAEPPQLAGVRMKDGSFYTIIGNGGSMGYADENSNIYTVDMAMNKILEVSKVDALLFLKEAPDADAPETEPSEANCYIVPIP